jgi:hypothetical protein
MWLKLRLLIILVSLSSVLSNENSGESDQETIESSNSDEEIIDPDLTLEQKNDFEILANETSYANDTSEAADKGPKTSPKKVVCFPMKGLNATTVIIPTCFFKQLSIKFPNSSIFHIFRLMQLVKTW